MGVIFLSDQFLPNDVPNAFPSMPTLEPRDGSNLTEIRQYEYTAYHDGAWYGMAVLAFFLLVICSLLAGLTLAVCGLDMTLVQVRTQSGSAKQRKQAAVVASLKCRGTWMLCSLILCSVACGESLPIVIQSLWFGRQQWIPILIATFLVAVFAEIIPQYVIPKRAIAWGYYCWSVIWFCMWLTAIISYPLSWLLDRLTGYSGQNVILTNEDIAGLLKYHGRSQKHGGMLTADAVRIMLGALSLDSRRLHGCSSQKSEADWNSEKDVEKADLDDVQDMVVNWSAVKTVDINDKVDEAFFERVKSNSYSRLPVVGGPDLEASDGSAIPSDWERMKIYGFLHIKNLLGLDLEDKDGSERSLHVRDLLIYPLPIIQETMTVYDLLNMFQLGMSRMAIVIPATPNVGRPLTTKSSANMLRKVEQLSVATDKRTLGRAKCCPHQAIGDSKWIEGFLEAAKVTIDKAINSDQKNVGINSPKPLGIVTFEDLIDAILQKTSLDERDFIDRQVTFPPTKSRRVGDFARQENSPNKAANIPNVPNYLGTAKVSLQPCRHEGTLFRRHVSNNHTGTGAMDGADDRVGKRNTSHDTIRREVKDSYLGSSYTQNSRGGFHHTDASGSLQGNTLFFSCADIDEFGGNPISSQPSRLLAEIASLPSLKRKKSTESMRLVALERRASTGLRFTQMPRVAPCSTQRHPPPAGHSMIQRNMADLILPIASMFCAPTASAADEDEIVDGSPLPNASPSIIQDNDLASLVSAREHVREKSGDIISLSTLFDGLDDFADRSTEVYEAFPSTDGTTQELESKEESVHVAPKLPTKQYDGFPIELLECNKENQGPNYPSHTFPRMVDLAPNCQDSVHDYSNCETTRTRERSFRDDGALLPSQKKRLQRSLKLGVRSSSFMF